MSDDYFIELDEDTGEVLELVRFLRSKGGLTIEEYTRGKWIDNPSKYYYYRDPPPRFEEIDKKRAEEIIRTVGENL